MSDEWHDECAYRNRISDLEEENKRLTAELAAARELLLVALVALEFCKEYFDGDVSSVNDAIARIDAFLNGE